MDTRRLSIFITILSVLLLGSFVAASCGRNQEETVASTSEQVTDSMLNGQSLVQQRCAKCHDLKRITRAKKTKKEWRATVERMVGKGANLGTAEQETVILYLAETYRK